MPSNHIYDIVEDNKGFLWLATDNGVSRFDGRYFQNFSVRDGLPSNDVLQVLKSADGTIWVNAYKQTPAYFDEINNKFISYQGSQQLIGMAKSLLGMTGMADGTIRFHNDLGIVFLKNKQVTQQRIKDEGFYAIRVNHETVDFTATEVFLKNKGRCTRIGFSQKGKETAHTLIPTGPGIIPRTLGNNDIYLFSDENVYKISVQSIQPLAYTLDSVTKLGPNYWHKFSGQNLNVINNKGIIFIMDRKTLTLRHTIPSRFAVNCAYIDRHKNLWVATLDQGLLYYSQNGIRKITSNPDFVNPNFLSLAVNSDGEIFAGNYYGQVLQVKNGQYLKHDIAVNTLFPWHRKIINIGKDIVTISDAGYSLNFRKYVNVLNVKGVRASLKTAIALNDSLIILGSTAGLIELNLRTKKTRALNSTYDRTLNLVKAGDNVIYYIGSKGLYKYRHDLNVSEFIPFKGFSEKKLTSLTYAADGTLWASTTSGSLVIFKDDQEIASISEDIGLPGNITRMLAAGNKLWIGSKNGISILEYAGTAPNFRYSLKNLSKTDGLPSNIVNDLALHRDTLYAATENGIAKIPASYRNPGFEVIPALTGVKINQVKTAISDDYTLESHQNNITLQFAGIEPSGHFKNLQYALNGPHHWNKMEGNTLNIQLNSGDNDLYVRAVDVNNHISKQQLKIHFYLKTPFYMAKWFWILMVFLGTGLIFWWLNLRKLNRQKIAFEQQFALEQQRNKITADLHDDIGASLSSLQVNSAVANHLLNKDPKQARKILEKIEDQSKNLADKIGDIIWSMKPGKDEFMTMSSRIKNFANDILSATEIDYKIKIATEIDKTVQDITLRKNIVLITKEAINNAAKYSKASQLNIRMEMAEQQIKLNITDNGIGFDAGAHQGNGLANMRKRTEELHGLFLISSELNKGTSISVSIPLVP